MKKILVYSLVLIGSAAIGLSIYSNQNTSANSDLMSQNIEALALNHYGGGFNIWCCNFYYCDPRNGYPIYYTVWCGNCGDVPYNFSEGSHYCWVD